MSAGHQKGVGWTCPVLVEDKAISGPSWGYSVADPNGSQTWGGGAQFQAGSRGRMACVQGLDMRHTEQH